MGEQNEITDRIKHSDVAEQAKDVLAAHAELTKPGNIYHPPANTCSWLPAVDMFKDSGQSGQINKR